MKSLLHHLRAILLALLVSGPGLLSPVALAQTEPTLPNEATPATITSNRLPFPIPRKL